MPEKPVCRCPSKIVGKHVLTPKHEVDCVFYQAPVPSEPAPQDHLNEARWAARDATKCLMRAAEEMHSLESMLLIGGAPIPPMYQFNPKLIDTSEGVIKGHLAGVEAYLARLRERWDALAKQHRKALATEAKAALRKVQESAEKSGASKMTPAEINHVIKKSRAGRRP